MKNIDLIEKQIEQFIETIRPEEEAIRKQLDIGFNYKNYTLEIFEVRPAWNNENEITHTPIAKTRYVKTQKVWKIYWIRASGQWEAYPPQKQVKTIQEFFEILKEDKHACFWG